MGGGSLFNSSSNNRPISLLPGFSNPAIFCAYASLMEGGKEQKKVCSIIKSKDLFRRKSRREEVDDQKGRVSGLKISQRNVGNIY